MADTGAHPGVRSLLARFENKGQNVAASPPSRGRSPVGSDHSGTARPLSKVRASFVAVDGSSPGSPVSGLRRSMNAEDLVAALKGPVSLPGNGLGFAQKAVFEQLEKGNAEKATVPKDSTQDIATSQPKTDALPAPTTSTGTGSSLKPTKTVTKRPSNVQVDKNISASKAASRSSSQLRTPTSPNPSNDRASKPARSTKPSVGSEPAIVATHKPSRASLSTATKTTSRSVRSSTPAREPVKPTVSTRPRLPTSTTTPSLSSAARGATSTNTSSLSGKPSSIRKPANEGQDRAITPAAASIRRQTSRAALPHQPNNERPSSRMSIGSTRPVDESFLARMMRPTTSSASKVHDKVDAKTPPRSARTAGAPRKVLPKTDLRASRPPKEKSESEQNQVGKTPAAVAEEINLKKELLPSPLLEEVSTETPAEASSDLTEKTAEPVVDVVEQAFENPVDVSVETTIEELGENPVEAPVPAPAEPSVGVSTAPEIEEPVEQPTEASAEQAPEAISSEAENTVTAPVDEVEKEEAEAPANIPNIDAAAESNEVSQSDLPAESVVEDSSEILS